MTNENSLKQSAFMEVHYGAHSCRKNLAGTHRSFRLPEHRFQKGAKNPARRGHRH